jgi:hypothetical protein
MGFDTIIPYAAAADLSAKQFHAVKDNGSGAAAAITAVTDAPIGILQNKPDAAGKSCSIDFQGVVKAILGGTVAKGDLLGPDANGKLVTRTFANGAGKWILARAGAAGVSGDLIGVVLLPVPIQVPLRGLFVSTEQTGTGSAQNIAHGLGVTPLGVLIAPTDTAPATTGAYTLTEGAHDATNVVATVTTGKKFKVLAWA